MNKLEIIEYIKKRYFSCSYIDNAVLDYINGDDASYGKIAKFPWTYSLQYEEKIVAELDGDDAETARRCLLAIASMRRDAVVMSRDDVKILRRIGVSLEYILCHCGFRGFYFRNSTCRSYAQWLMEYYHDETVKIITPSLLEQPISSEENKKNKCIAYFMAAELVAEGEGGQNKLLGLFKKSLSDCVLDYALRNGSLGVCLVSLAYKTNKYFAEFLCKRLKEAPSGHVRELTNIYNADEIKDMMLYLGLHDEYAYCAVLGIFGDKIRIQEAEKASKDEENLLPYMIRRAGGTKWIIEISPVCEPLLMALKDGRGQECLRQFEKLYIHLCGGFANSLNIPADRFCHLVMLNKEKAAEELSFTDKSMEGSYHPNGFSTLVRLYDYSNTAHDIVTTLLLAAEKHLYDNGIRRFAEMQRCFCCVRAQSFGIPVYDSLMHIVNLGVSVKTSLHGIMQSCMNFYARDWKAIFDADDTVRFVKENMSTAIEVYEQIKGNAASAACWSEFLCVRAGCNDAEFLLELLKNKSKVVSRLASDAIHENEEEIRPALEELMPKLKGDTLRKAKSIIKKWDNEHKYGADFTFATNALAEEFIADNYDKSLEKKISFIHESCFEGVHYADLSGNVPADMIKYIFMEYMNLDSPYKLAVCSKLAERMFTPDFCSCIENIYQSWLENGADNKTKMIMVPYCIFASDTQILALKKQLIAWAEASRGALGAFVINAIALNGGSAALMMVNDISVKFPNNQVKSAAKSAFSFAAEALGVPIDVLADKIVPDLGLDRNGERVIDYGSRTFTLSLMPDFTLSIYDNSKGKAVKSLPKPNADDDAAKAETAKKYMSDLKKQLKAVTASQKTRLEDVFRNGRTWNTADWNALFVENPVMHRFARNLIWGIYENKALVNTFRYTDDGTFCDMNDDEFELPENAAISLVHPIELTDEAIEAWTEQLADYEIVQPFAQISANIIKLTDDDMDEKCKLTKYAERKFITGSMTGAAKKYSLVRSSIEDGGGFRGYHIQDRVLGIGMAICGENMYVGQSYDESVLLEDVFFYKMPEGESIPDSYNDYDSINPLELSGRFVSCCLNILEGILE